MTRRCALRLILFFTILIVALPANGQTVSPGPQVQIDSLSTLPEFDAVLYLNTSRILNDAIPRLLPEKQLNDLHDGMDQLKTSTTIDLSHVEQVVVVARFNKLSPGVMIPIPDAMIVARGDFDAKFMLGVATLMSDGKLREEKYGAHSLYTFSLSKDAKNANPFEAAFSEIAITSLDANSIAVGNTNYIKMALNAADGGMRVKPETLARLVRDPNALMSAAGSPLVAFAKVLGLKILENPDPNCMTRFGEYYVSLTMTNDAFKINGILNADNPDTAAIVKALLTGLFNEGKSLVGDKSAQSMFDQLKLSVEGDEIIAEASITQDMASKFVRDMLAPKPSKPAATEAKTVTKTKTRKSRR